VEDARSRLYFLREIKDKAPLDRVAEMSTWKDVAMQHTPTPTEVAELKKKLATSLTGTLVGKRQGCFKSAHSRSGNFQEFQMWEKLGKDDRYIRLLEHERRKVAYEIESATKATEDKSKMVVT